MTKAERRERYYPLVREMRANGWPKIADIAAHFGLPQSTVTMWCADMKPPKGKPRKAVRGINRAKVEYRSKRRPYARELAGTTYLTWAEIGAKFGISARTARIWCKGVRRPDGCGTKIEGVAGFSDLNNKMRRLGYSREERISLIHRERARQEMRHGA